MKHMRYTAFGFHYMHILEALQGASAEDADLNDLDAEYGQLLIDYVLADMPFGPDLVGFARWVRAYAVRN